MKPYVNKRVKNTLSKNNACYVLITCNDSSENGKMEVEMSYQGDASLASYLLQGAQSALDEQFEEIYELPKTSKITPIS